MAERIADETHGSWRGQLHGVEAVLADVNRATGDAWRAESRFAGGVLEGAWRVHDGDALAVLKWHAPTSEAPYNPDAPAIVEVLRAAGYPTPAWLASGRTPAGDDWSLQELVDAQPLRELDLRSADLFIDLVERQRGIGLPTAMSWNPYIRDHVFSEHRLHVRLQGGGPNVRALLDSALAVAAPFRDAAMPDQEMVHCDLNVSNVLVRDQKVAAVVDIDGAGRGCAVYDLLSPAVNGVSWSSDPAAVETLVSHALRTYDAASVATSAACLLIETTAWYQGTMPEETEHRAKRHLDWLDDLASRLT